MQAPLTAIGTTRRWRDRGAVSSMYNGLSLTARGHTSKVGMTLVEVILAISVAAFVLTAATSFVVSVSSIWAERESRHFFEDHVDGVTEFMKASFGKAGVFVGTNDNNDTPLPKNPSNADNQPADSNTTQIGITKDNANNKSIDISQTNKENAGLVKTSEAPVRWTRLPGAGNYEKPLLAFKLTEMPLLFMAAENLPSSGGVEVFVHFKNDMGLSLLWYSLLQEEVEEISDLQRTEISSLVKALHYIYWDDSFEKWEQTEEPIKGEGDEEYLLPRYLKLVFEYEDETKERILAVPVPSQSVLLF